MNFVHLADVFEGKGPNEVYDLLSKATETFLNIDNGVVSSESIGKRIVVKDDKKVDSCELNRQVKINRDLYENLVTSLSWKNLDFYLGELDCVVDMEHAAFIIAISDQTVNISAKETSKDNLEEIIQGLEETDLLLFSTSVIDVIYGIFDVYSIIISDD